MIPVLAIILVVLLYFIGGERGMLSFFSLCLNILVVSLSVILMSWGYNPLLVTFINCVIITYITLIFQNGKNEKTISSFISVIIVLIILILLTYIIVYKTQMQGINEILRHDDVVLGLSPNLSIDMTKLAVSMIIMGLIGAATDTSIAISSAIYEVYKNNENLNSKELFRSGLSMGKDILGAMVNTLYFACLGESMMLFLLFKNYNYSILTTINSKAFFQQFVYTMFSALSIALVIPITSMVLSRRLKKPKDPSVTT